MKVYDFALNIDNKKPKIFGSTQSSCIQHKHFSKFDLKNKEHWWSTRILIEKLLRRRSHAAKMFGSRSNCLELTRKTAQSQMIDLENKCQRHLQLTAVRWPKYLNWLAGAFQGDASKFSQCKEIAEWNSDSLSLKMIGCRRNYWILIHNLRFISQWKMLFLGSVDCFWCISWRTNARTFVCTAPWHNTVYKAFTPSKKPDKKLIYLLSQNYNLQHKLKHCQCPLYFYVLPSYSSVSQNGVV